MPGSKRLCAIQMSASDLIEPLKQYNSVEPLKRSGIFDYIALVVPDLPSSNAIEAYADYWEVGFFRGEITNVTKRILDCAIYYGAEVIARVLPCWFFLDVDLVNRQMIVLEQEGLDYIMLPRDFDIRFGADVTHARFFQKVLNAFCNTPDIAERYQFNPWGYAEIHDADFTIDMYQDVPTYDMEKFFAVRNLLNEIWPDRWNKADSPHHPYTIATHILRANPFPNPPRSLDLACGFGSGTYYLARQGISVVGVDIDTRVIEKCRQRYADMPTGKLSFVAGDYKDLDFPTESFDIITSIHTMEHVHDDVDFLQRCQSWLRNGGYIVLEVPLLMKRPFSASSEPLNPFHMREYSMEGLTSLMARFFDIVTVYGVTRGYYVETEKARNAVLVVARKSG